MIARASRRAQASRCSALPASPVVALADARSDVLAFGVTLTRIRVPSCGRRCCGNIGIVGASHRARGRAISGCPRSRAPRPPGSAGHGRIRPMAAYSGATAVSWRCIARGTGGPWRAHSKEVPKRPTTSAPARSANFRLPAVQDKSLSSNAFPHRTPSEVVTVNLKC